SNLCSKGTASVTDSTWNIITTLNFQALQNEIQNFKDLKNQLDKLCFYHNLDSMIQFCQHSLDQYDYKLLIIRKRFDAIADLLSHKRNKRALDFLGTAWKWLAGTPDASDAEFYNNAIQGLRTDQTKFEILLKDQNHVLQNVVTTFNASITSIQNYTAQ
ncbi:hypothetical protein ILUMI_15033, partial [Ignelater luminosus]